MTRSRTLVDLLAESTDRYAERTALMMAAGLRTDAWSYTRLWRSAHTLARNLGEEYRLKPGDSFYFESATPHRWKNPGRKETWVLWINTPPTF